MKILMLTTRFPFPLSQGDRLRSYHQMALLSKTHQITLVSSIEEDCDAAGIDQVGQFCASMELFPITQQRRMQNIGRVSTYDFPFQIPQWFSQEIQRRIQRLLAAESFDVIYLQMAKAVLYLPKGNSVPVVMDFVDAWSLNLARLARDRNCAKLVRTCSQTGVKFFGYVPDLNEYLERATVSIAPMRSGSGIQNKVLEAMAAGIPVVATTVGLGGLRAVPGEHLLVADTPYDFTDAILQIFHNPSLRQNLVCKARGLVKDFYSWEASVQALDDIYQSVTQGVSPVRTASNS